MPEKKESSSSPSSSEATGEKYSLDTMALFTVVECPVHEFHVVGFFPEILEEEV